VILYESTFEGTRHELGTSGFLYRSDKLMYDRATQSLWNTLQGRPVIGPLVGKGIQLVRRSVVTTTWGEWRRRHPTTTVLSLDTGFQRDYREGVAYRAYFGTDELMFSIPTRDSRLKNKDEVLGLIFDEAMGNALAIEIEYLRQHPTFHGELDNRKFVVFTDPSGAARVYESKDFRFERWDGDRTARDSRGRAWQLFEDRLRSESGETLKRLPQHRAFWFGWHAAFPETELIRRESAQNESSEAGSPDPPPPGRKER